MSTKCPKCQSENSDTLKYCGECGTQLTPGEKSQPSFTKTLETPIENLARGTLFAYRYEIIEELGKGGMGKVYRALDTEVKEEVAVKLIKPEIAQDEATIDRFRNELKVARKVSHRNICRMHDLGKAEEGYFITMEYVGGEDLKSFIRKKGKLSIDEAIGVVQQVCEGLAEAHELGVIHRDMKPQNIMIDVKGKAKIMDFGIARSVEAPGVTATGVIIGTPDYISPEQAEGEEADERSDIYSLGVILYEMVTGSVPFKGDTAFSVALKHKTHLPPDPRKLNPGISENLSRLILICMEKERLRRYQKAEELLADLKNVEENFPLGTKIRPRRKTSVATLIRKKYFIPALVVALAIIAVVFWQLLSTKEIPPITSDRPSLAIVYFENLSGDESLEGWRIMLADLMTTDLEFQKLVSQESMVNFNCRYLIKLPSIHSKVYAWYRKGKPYSGYLGSANYTQYGFIGSQRECMSEISATYGFGYYSSIFEESMDCLDASIESHIKIYDERYLPKRKKIEFEEERTSEGDAELRGILNNLNKKTFSWLASNGSLPQKSGLNWGQRLEYNREPNQAYIPVPSTVYQTDFLPDIGERFLVLTDDNNSLVCVRAQQNGKAIQTPENNSLLGIYFRQRWCIPLGAPVLKDDLIKYGRTDIDFYKIDETKGNIESYAGGWRD